MPFYVVQVSCAVRSYWQSLPAVRSSFIVGVADHFIGLECYSVHLCINILLW